MYSCAECGSKYDTLRRLKRHYSDEHSGEIETPEEHLPDHNSEQRDFEGKPTQLKDYS